MQLHTGSDSFVHKVCFVRHEGILMLCTDLAGCALMAACSLAQGCGKLHSPHCFAMKNTNMAWVAANSRWLLMMEGATAPSFSVVDPCLADRGHPGTADASKKLATILCIGSSSYLSEAGMKGLRVV